MARSEGDSPEKELATSAGRYGGEGSGADVTVAETGEWENRP